jgi:hypothetical protein
MQALLQVELVEVGGHLARHDAAHHQVVGAQPGLVEHQQAPGEAFALEAQAERAAAAEPGLPRGGERRAPPALDAARGGAQHGRPRRRGVEAEEVAVRERRDDQRLGRDARLALTLEGAAREARAIAPRLLRLVPDQQQVVGAEDARGVLQHLLDPLATQAVTRPGRELGQLAAQRLLVGTEVAEQQRHHREVAAADDEAVELERGIVQHERGVEAEPEEDRQRGERGPQHATPAPAQRGREQQEDEVDEQRADRAFGQIQQRARYREVEQVD